MKKYLLFIPFLLLGSCKILTFAFKLQHEMNFDINQSVASTFSGTRILDPSTNKEFKKNIDKIKDIRITKITYTIINFDGPTTLTANASFEAADAIGNGKVKIGTFSNLNVASQVGKEIDLNVPTASLEALAGFMQASPNRLTVYYSGSVNQAPAKLNLNLKFYNEVEVGAF